MLSWCWEYTVQFCAMCAWCWVYVEVVLLEVGRDTELAAMAAIFSNLRDSRLLDTCWPFMLGQDGTYLEQPDFSRSCNPLYRYRFCSQAYTDESGIGAEAWCSRSQISRAVAVSCQAVYLRERPSEVAGDVAWGDVAWQRIVKRGMALGCKMEFGSVASYSYLSYFLRAELSPCYSNRAEIRHLGASPPNHFAGSSSKTGAKPSSSSMCSSCWLPLFESTLIRMYWMYWMYCMYWC